MQFLLKMASDLLKYLIEIRSLKPFDTTVLKLVQHAIDVFILAFKKSHFLHKNMQIC